MLGNAKLQVGGTGVGGAGTGNEGGLEPTEGGLKADPEDPPGPDEAVPDACGEPGPPTAVEVPLLSWPLDGGRPGVAKVPLVASTPDSLVVMGGRGATAPPQPAAAKARASDARARGRDRRQSMGSI
jgi:hypothetical protein